MLHQTMPAKIHALNIPYKTQGDMFINMRNNSVSQPGSCTSAGYGKENPGLRGCMPNTYINHCSVTALGPDVKPG